MSKKPFRQRETVQNGKLQVQKGVVSTGLVKYTGTKVLSVSFFFPPQHLLYSRHSANCFANDSSSHETFEIELTVFLFQ